MSKIKLLVEFKYEFAEASENCDSTFVHIINSSKWCLTINLFFIYNQPGIKGDQAGNRNLSKYE